MAVGVLIEHGGDPYTCGDYRVRVAWRECDSDSALIKVEYNEWVNSHCTCTHRATLQWNGTNLTESQVAALLDSANVPLFVREANAGGLIFRALRESKEAAIRTGRPLSMPSISVSIESSREDYGGHVDDDEDVLD